MKKLILIVGATYNEYGKYSGAKHAGKTTVREYIMGQPYAVADYVKKKISEMFGVSMEWIEKSKDNPKAFMIAGKYYDMRFMLEKLGNDYLNDIGGKYALCNILNKNMQLDGEPEVRVVHDVRLIREIKYFCINNLGYRPHILVVQRKNYGDTPRPDPTDTESALIIQDIEDFGVDYSFISASNLEELHTQAQEFIKSINS